MRSFRTLQSPSLSGKLQIRRPQTCLPPTGKHAIAEARNADVPANRVHGANHERKRSKLSAVTPTATAVAITAPIIANIVMKLS